MLVVSTGSRPAARRTSSCSASTPCSGSARCGSGLWLWVRRPANRIGSLTVAAGILMLVASAYNTTSTVATFVGAMVALAPIAALLHLVVAFPSGMIREPAGRCMVVGGYVIAILPELPVYLSRRRWHPVARPTRPRVDRNGRRPGAGWSGLRPDALRRGAPDPAGGGPAARFVRRSSLAVAYAYGWLSILTIPLHGAAPRGTRLVGVHALRRADGAVALVPVVLVISVALGGFGRTLDLAELGAWLGAGASVVPRRPQRSAVRSATRRPQLLYEVPGSSVPGRRARQPVALPTADGTRRTVPVLGPRGTRAHLVYDAELNADQAMGGVRRAGARARDRP